MAADSPERLRRNRHALPVRASTGIITFCATVSSGNTLMIWKDRQIPIRTR